MKLREARLAMIRAFPGGWDAMAAALGMSRMALENRVYERKGQSLLTETDLQMQAFSETDFFAAAVAVASGGTFVKLPGTEHIDNDSLLAKFNALHAKLGQLSSHFAAHISDDEIDDGERADLKRIGNEIHATLEELLALMFRIYCKHTDELRHVPHAKK